jgi:hypothetical protein
MLDYVSIPAYGYVYSMVLGVSSLVFVGMPIARQPEWLDVVSAYLTEVVATASALRPYPTLLRPLLRPFLAPKSRMQAILRKANIVLLPAIQERMVPEHEQKDLLGFLVQSCETVDPLSIILKLLVLVSAAASYPELWMTSSDLE